MVRNIVSRFSAAVALSAMLSACGGGGGDGGDDPAPPASFTVSATVSGLSGTGLVLRNNGGNDLAVSVNGTATFTNALSNGANYDVTVAIQPSAPAQTCTVTNGTGTIANANVSNVAVNCATSSPDAPVVSLSGDTKLHSLQWAPAARASFYRVYKTRSTATDYQLISGDLLATTFIDPVAVHLENWAALRYRVDACNATGCASSVPSVPTSSLPLIGYFKAGDSQALDFLGRRVVISSDGNTVAIGAVGEDDAPPGGTGDDSGAVYVYVRDTNQGTWVQQVRLKASDSSLRWFFGVALSISDDGNTLAVGALRDATIQGIPGNNPGAAYVFARNASAGTWTEQARLQASNATPRDEFGTAVAISGDGNTLLVGAASEDSGDTGVSAVAATDSDAPISGAAYVFTRNAGSWTQQNYIKASNTDAGDMFGKTVAVSADGATLVIGAPGEDSSAIGVNGDQSNNLMLDTGAVYVFQRSGNTWVQEAYVKSPFPDPDGGVPNSSIATSGLALSSDGSTLAVTALDEASNARGIGGDPTDMSMPWSGAAYVYVRASGAWTHQAYVKASNTETNDQFGTSIDLSEDGDIMAIGAPNESSRAAGAGGDQDDNGAQDSGAVYVFRRAGTSWTQVSYVHAHSPDAGDLFGTSVSLSGDGESLVVGAPQEDGDGNVFNADADDETAQWAGAAYIF